jgi:hypothetical protein
MTDEKIIQKLTAELLNGRKSHQAGNHGRARVCARRAAGWAIQEYLMNQGKPISSTIALDQIKHLSTIEGLSDRIYRTLHHLTIRLKKDSLEEDAYYPIEDVDLVSEAHWLVEELLQIDLPLD